MSAGEQLKRKLTKQEAEAVVRRHGWLSEAPRAFQDQVLAKCDLLHLKPTQSVYEVGDEAGGLFGVVQGHLELHLPVHDLSPTLAFMGGPGFWAGDAAAVRGHPRMITILAGSVCQLFRLSRVEMQRLTAKNPMSGSYVAMLLARNLAVAINTIDALKRSNPVERVAATLVNLLELLPHGCAVVDVSQSDLASMANLGRGSVNAALSKLHKRGMIRRHYGSIEVTDAVGLCRIVGRPGRVKS